MRKNFYAIIFLIFLGASFSQAQTYDRANLWQKEIDAFIETDRRETPPANPVLFVGSSSFRKWDNLRTDFPRFKVINRGFGGSFIEDINFYFDRLVTPYQPKIIFFYAGENDITAGKLPEEVLRDFEKFAALVREKSPHSKLYFVSLKPSPSRWKLHNKFERANSLIKAEIAKNSRMKFIDVWTAMLNEKGEPKPEIFVEDKLHLNEKGYAIWRKIFNEYLK